MHIDLNNTVHRLNSTLDALESGGLNPDVVCARFRVASLQWPDLPQRYESVLERLLEPLDSAAQVSEDSGTFSHAAAISGLRLWLTHASALQRH